MENNFPIVDFDEMCEKISVKTGISLEDVITVLDAESEYLASLGIVAVIAVDTFVDILSDVLKSGDYLYIGSLGKFETKDIPAKTMTYLKGDKTGQHYVKPAYKKITFRPSKALKDKLERD